MRKLFILIMTIILGLIVGCSNNKANENISGETSFIYGSGNYTSINPALYEHGEINSLIFSGLTAHDANNKIIPSLAENWGFDTDTNTYTFNLRKGVKWHDGKNFTADDVKFTLETIINPDNTSEIASNYEDITKIEVVDENIIKITLKAPNVAMLDYLTIGILPKHLLYGKDIITDSFNQSPIGTGPYKLEKWVTKLLQQIYKNIEKSI